jgi:hypothetical protein
LKRSRAGAIVAFWLTGAAGLAGCGGETPVVQTANIARVQEPPARPYPESAEQWGAYRSVRFRMSIPLPNPRSWKIDDKTRAELVATDASTRSTLTILSEIEPSLVNHQLCEARARTLGLVSDAAFQTVEDIVTVGPEAYDTRVRVGVEKGVGPERRLVGHVFAFGAYVTKCFVLHLSTEVRAEEDEQTLSQRLALARIRTLGGIKVEELGNIPRGKTPP